MNWFDHMFFAARSSQLLSHAIDVFQVSDNSARTIFDDFLVLVDKALNEHTLSGYLKSIEQVFMQAKMIVKSCEQALEWAYQGRVHESVVALMSPGLKEEWPFEAIKGGTATVVAAGSGDHAIVVNV